MKYLLLSILVFPVLTFSQIKRDTIKLSHGGYELEPAYKAGQKALDKLFGSYKYPATAKRDKLEDSVFVQYAIDTLGCITDVKILNYPRNDFKQEVLRLVYSQKQWLPAERNGRKVKGWKKRVIYFKL
jgi:protein TonB